MKLSKSLALLSLLCVGCHTDPFSDRRHPYSDPTVHDDVYVNVPESDRDEIAKIRTEWNELKDRVDIAERNVEQERQRLGVAKAELDAAEAGARAARKGLDVAYESEESIRQREIESAQRNLEAARAQWLSAKSKIAFHDANIDQLKAEVDLTKTRMDLAESRMELAKAKAVHKLDRPEARDIAVSEFEASVKEHEAIVAMAEVDAEAWQKKVKIRQAA
ncbi:MAG: hypothetical protein ABIP42_00580, partial [Planctomycetota bacterium]